MTCLRGPPGNPGLFQREPVCHPRDALLSLLWPDPRVLTTAFDVDMFIDVQTGVHRLSYRNQDAARGADNDLLPGLGCVVFFLHLIARHSSPDSAQHHRHIPTGATTDETAKTEARKPADNRTDSRQSTRSSHRCINPLSHREYPKGGHKRVRG
jgi:hypothetical protein